MTIVERPEVEPPPLEDLDAGVIEEARARERRHRGLAGAALVVAAIAALVATSLGGGGSGNQASRGLAPAQPRPITSAPTALAACVHPEAKHIDEGTPSRSLLSILAVLRRGARPADALPPSDLDMFTSGGVAHIFGGNVFVRYVRRARVIGSTSYYVIPSLFSDCTAYKFIGDGVTLYQGSKNGSGSGGRDYDATEIEQGMAYYDSSGLLSHRTSIAMLIPDGVATVTLVYPPGEVGGSDPNRTPGVTIKANVVGNVFAATVPLVRNGMAPVTMIWRATSGSVVKTFHRL
jgi:hypothetical protein